MIWEKPRALFPPKLGLDLRSGRRQKFTSDPTILIISRLEFDLAKLRKRYFLNDIPLKWPCNSTVSSKPGRWST